MQEARQRGGKHAVANAGTRGSSADARRRHVLCYSYQNKTAPYLVHRIHSTSRAAQPRIEEEKIHPFAPCAKGGIHQDGIEAEAPTPT